MVDELATLANLEQARVSGYNLCWPRAATQFLARLTVTCPLSPLVDLTQRRRWRGVLQHISIIMDLKMNSLAWELLGMRLTMRLPRPKLRKEEQEAEYKISIVRHEDKTEMRPRAFQMPNNVKKQEGILKKDSMLKYDNRVVNQLLTVEQLQNIQNWLGQQPESFVTEEVEEQQIMDPAKEQKEKVQEEKDMVDKRQENLVEVMDGFLEEVTKSTNFYRDIANNHNKQHFLRKKVVTLV